MRARNFCHLSSVLVLVFFLLCYTPCFAAPIAKVLSLVPGVVAEREGKTVPLQVKDDIYLQDVLRSNANGKAQIIFEDDTVLTLGNNTTFSMQEYNDTDNPAFKGNMGSGFARFVTGQIVSKNPEAFESIIRYMYEQGIGYGSVNHPLDRDPICGFVGTINDVCPRCGRREGQGVSIETLKELRRKYPDMPAWKEQTQ